MQLVHGGANMDEPIENKIEKALELLDAEKKDQGVAMLRDALRDLDAAAKKSPDNAELHYLAGRSHFYLEENEEALAAYDRAIKLAPEMARFHFMRGILLKYMEKYAEAEQSLTRSAELSPKHAGTWQELGQVRTRLGRFDDAAAAMKKALDLEPENSALAFEAGCIEMERGDSKAAAGLFKRSSDLEPLAANPAFNCGQAYQNLQMHKEALTYFQRAAKSEPDDRRACSKVIQTFEALGQKKERDRERERMLTLKKAGKVHEEHYCRDQFMVGGDRVLVLEYFELRGDRAVRYSFLIRNNKSDEPIWKISLGSYDYLTEFSRAQGEIGKEQRIFHLDDYPRDGGHATIRMFKSEPSYDETKALVLDYLKGGIQAQSRMTPTSKGSEIEIDRP